MDPHTRLRLAPHVRLRFDTARGQHTLLAPEAVMILNDTGAAIVQLCDGRRTMAQIQSQLRNRYTAVCEDDIRDFVAALVAQHAVEVDHG